MVNYVVDDLHAVLDALRKEGVWVDPKVEEYDEISPQLEFLGKIWCGREDSNLHGIATASPSSWCVCQFRHYRK